MLTEPVRTLCMTLAYAGCRLSEALALPAREFWLRPFVRTRRPVG
jgi:hypothetical protein